MSDVRDIMSRYEKIDFMTFFDVRTLKWLQNGPEGLNVLENLNYQ